MKPHAVAIYAPTPKGFAAIVHSDRKGIEVPAGSIEPGERPVDAAERELFEETGLRARRLQRLGNVSTNDGGVCAVFLALGIRGRLRGSEEGFSLWVDIIHLLGPDATFRHQNAEALQRIGGFERRVRARAKSPSAV